jgi:hypothetical protein
VIKALIQAIYSIQEGCGDKCSIRIPLSRQDLSEAEHIRTHRVKAVQANFMFMRVQPREHAGVCWQGERVRWSAH